MRMMKDSLPADLKTERLTLTRPVMDHAPAIARLANNKQVHRWMSRLPFPYSLEDARQFIEEFAVGGSEHCFALVRQEGEFIGIMGLHFVEGQAPELGYWLGEPYWGQGYASEAGKAVIGAARQAGFAVLRSRALTSNSRSRNVLRKLGFVEIGEGPDPAGANSGQPATFMQLEFET
ncbi:MAG: hypothetical protein ABS75_19070 [Pelagibacterium sp. SCN 63-23]|nr:MAG: hypothetical protein ABS75_19070 [Pelagibacterium sp. SCN 63-23]